MHPHKGKGFVGATSYYDKRPPYPTETGDVPMNYRDNIVGRLYKKLTVGKSYCVAFWVNLAESSGLGQNKIGAYLDDGTINNIPDTLGQEINTVKPQVYSNAVIIDTGAWTKIEGSFTANGTEQYISLGNFFPNDSVTTVITNYWSFFLTQYSYYLIDDVSVIPLDIKADAGADRNVPLGQTNKIGRVGDTTATGLDCKWYHKGKLIDSGAVITVNSGSSVGVVDTYVVVQTICGLVKTDTMLLRTVPTGIPLLGGDRGGFSVMPNPSTGKLTITSVIPQGSVHAKVFDLLGRVVYNQQLSFSNNQTSINLDVLDGIYILEVSNYGGEVYRQKVEVRQ